jgi:DNA-binding transcriptional ArsR family regulator
MYTFPPFFRAIGHPVRQKIICILHPDKELPVNKLVEELKLSQSTVSHHLSILKKANILRAREEGAQTHYSICCETIASCCASLQKFFHCKHV